ncbi:39S ribosomal protein L34, mitochondrial [Bombina bombina]|uniref:39S ribosomal protein L34, mitochondrial n=1 Tax=Bombina bombina TaxID=8345 RepID=UPI00235B26BC|nr:39S ribosomal protein L34, mitochondrial [Bombina bombina]
MALTASLGRLLLMKQAVPPLSAPIRTLTSLSHHFSGIHMPSSLLPAGSSILARNLPLHWSFLPVRTKKRGMEYQPKFLKRKRTHGWLKRISTRGGIEVILRRMLKGRKSLTH